MNFSMNFANFSDYTSCVISSSCTDDMGGNGIIQ